MRSGEGDKAPTPEDLEREAARDLQRAGGGGPRPTGMTAAAAGRGSLGGWSPPAPGQPLMPDTSGLGRGTAEQDDDEEFKDDETVTELALGWLAEQKGAADRPLEEMIVRVDPDSAYAARDQALKQFLERREILQKNLPTVPWDPSKRLTIGKRKPGSAKKAAAKKAAAKKAGKRAAKKQPPLPIAGYDRLGASEIIDRLDSLSDDELDLIAEYEERNQDRAEILDAIDDMFEDEDEPSVPAKKAPVKKTPVKKATAKKTPVKKATAKKTPVKKATAKKTVAKKTPVKKATAKKATAKKTPAKNAAAKKVATAGSPPLPIADYDRLSPAEIVPQLDPLSDDELDLIADYEERNQNRAEILDAIDDMFE